MGAIAIVLSMGGTTPLYGWLLTAVPVFRFFRGPARFFLWSSLSLAALAAYGTAWISHDEAEVSRRRLRLVMVGLILAMAVGLYATLTGPGLAWLVHALQEPFVRERAVGTASAAALRDIRRAGVILVAMTLIVALVKGRRINRNLGVGSIGLLLLGELYMLSANFYLTAGAAMLAPVNHSLVLEEGAYCIASRARAYRTLYPNTGMLEGVADVSASLLVGLRHVDEFSNWMWRDFAERGGRSPLLDFFGARYLYDPSPHRWYVPVETKGLPLKNPNAMLRGSLVTEYEVVNGPSDMERRLRGSEGSSTQHWIRAFNPARTVFLYDRPSETFGLRAREDAGRILRRGATVSTGSLLI